MNITMAQYLINPAGKGSAIIPNSEDLKNKYKNELESVKGFMMTKWYKKASSLICHVKFPSSSNTKVLYDVVFEFDVHNKDLKSIVDAPMRMFSNCPSFLFTYAFAIYHHDIGVKWLKDKIGNQYLKTPASQKNVFNIVSYEKSIYISLLYLRYGNLNPKILDSVALPVNNFNKIKNDILSSDQVMQLYKETKETKKPVQNQQIQQSTSPKTASSAKTGSSSISGRSRTTRNTKNVRKTSTSKKTKKI